MIKNVIVINDYDYEQGGASKVAIDTANSLALEGLNVIFFSVVHSDKCTLNTLVKNVTLNGKEALKENNRINGIINGLYNRKCENKLNTLLKEYDNKDTIIHIHGWTKACSSAVFRVARKRSFKIVLTLHDYFSICPNGAFLNFKTNKCCYLKACSIHCLLSNCDSRNIFFKYYRFIRQLIYRKDIHLSEIGCIFVSTLQKKIISQQVEISNLSEIICSPIEELDENYCSNKKYDFIYIGRDSKEKGIDLFIQLAEKLDDKSFIIVGNYKGQKPNNLIVTGWVSERDVEHYLKDSDCLVVPSLLPEPFGLVVVKAIAFGVKCLISNNIGSIDYINDNNGLTFKQSSLEDLYNKALKIEDVFSIPNKEVLVSKKNYAINTINFYEKVINN